MSSETANLRATRQGLGARRCLEAVPESTGKGGSGRQGREEANTGRGDEQAPEEATTWETLRGACRGLESWVTYPHTSSLVSGGSLGT